MKKVLLLTILLILFLSQKQDFTALEIDKNITRQEYLGNGLGKMYGNRFGIYYFNNIYPKVEKIENNFFKAISKSYLYTTVILLIIYLGQKHYEN